MKPDFDVLVVGGAMTGAGLAALLATHPPTSSLRVGLLEPRPAEPPASGARWDLRVSALSRASQRMLQVAGAWDAVVARGAGAYRRMVVWDAAGRPDGDAAVVFDAAELGEPDLGHIVENLSVQAALLQRAMAAGVVLLRTGVESMEADDAAVRLTTADGRRLAALLVVGADGSQSTVRALAGIESRGWEYQQHAVVTHLRCGRSPDETAWQRFLPSGPLALLPLPDGRASLVWTTTPAEAAGLVACDEAEFNRRVTAASGSVLGELASDAPRASFPLRLAHAARYSGPRLALVGDAAHTVHPLAGQGANLGLMDCAALVDVIAAAVAAGDDPGETHALRRYERWRKAEALPAMALLDGLNRLFGIDIPPFAALRRRGMDLVDGIPPLKRALMRRALGLAGEVPDCVAPRPVTGGGRGRASRG